MIASGPSLTRADAAHARARCGRVLVVNDAWRLCPDADALYACDGQWWRHHEGVPDFAGEKWTQDQGAAAALGLRWVKCDTETGVGLSSDPRLVRSGSTGGGNNGGHQAFNMAVLRGAARIVLLGFDMKLGAGAKRHFFGDHPGPLNRDSNYAAMIEGFRPAAADAAALGVEVVNCTPGSGLDAFPRVPLEEVL